MIRNVREDADYFYWLRGENSLLSPHFSTLEHTCHCGVCVEQKIAKELIVRNENIRQQLGNMVFIRVLSGYRCAAYQAGLAKAGLETAKGVSQHELGNAADIEAAPALMHKLRELVRETYTAYGMAPNFIHVDLRGPHADGTPRVWAYAGYKE